MPGSSLSGFSLARQIRDKNKQTKQEKKKQKNTLGLTQGKTKQKTHKTKQEKKKKKKLPSNIRGCQSGMWSAGQKKIRGTSTKLPWEQKKNTNIQKRQRESNRNNKIHRPEKDRRGAFDRESLA